MLKIMILLTFLPPAPAVAQNAPDRPERAQDRRESLHRQCAASGGEPRGMDRARTPADLDADGRLRWIVTIPYTPPRGE